MQRFWNEAFGGEWGRGKGEGGPSGAGLSMSVSERPIARPVGYDTSLVPDDREVNAYE
jgi:hypothetical protein